MEERLLEAHWLLGDDSSAPVELSKQLEEMVVSKDWLVGGQGSKGESMENGGQGKIGWERARLAVAKRWPGQKVLELQNVQLDLSN